MSHLQAFRLLGIPCSKSLSEGVSDNYKCLKGLHLSNKSFIPVQKSAIFKYEQK